MTEVTHNGRRMNLRQVADFLVADTYFDVALESTRDLLLAIQVRTQSLASSIVELVTFFPLSSQYIVPLNLYSNKSIVVLSNAVGSWHQCLWKRACHTLRNDVLLLGVTT